MAKWQRRVYRGLVAGLLGGVAATGWLIYQTTSSTAVRQQVIAHLRQRFAGAEVALGSAKLRLLGGITFSNLTMYRRDDPSQTPFLHVPAGVIHHDKEQLGQGRLVIRKIKFERPRLTAVRGADGRWNLSGILGPVRPDVPIPVFEVEQGTVIVDVAESQQPGGSAIPAYHAELNHVNGTMLNHPLQVLNFDMRGSAKAIGPLCLRGSWHRVHEQLNAGIDLAPVSFGPPLLREFVRLAPGWAEPIEQLAGDGRLHLDVQYAADAKPAWRHQIRAEIEHGRLVHRKLPFPVENVALTARCDDGHVAIESLTATSGSATIRAKAQLDAVPAAEPAKLPAAEGEAEDAGVRTPHPESLLAGWLAPFQGLDFSVTNWPLNFELFDRLPASFLVYRQRFAPTGLLNFGGRLQRNADGWTASVTLQPTDMAFRFEAFPYPLKHVRGALELVMARGRPPRLTLDVQAEGSERRPVSIKGYVAGNGPDPEYAYDIRADGVPLDETLFGSLPGKFENVARSFHPRGQFDIVGAIRRAAGASHPVQDYRIEFRGAGVCYDVFPIPLDRLTGRLDMHLAPPGDPAGSRFVFSDIRGDRAGGRITLNGAARPLPHGTRIDLSFRGAGWPLDHALGTAFNRLKLHSLWEMFAPSGQMDFQAELTHIDTPNAPPEFTLRIAPRGATIHPTFFPYTLTDLGGTFDISRNQVMIDRLSARHGATVIQLHQGAVRFAEGGYTADLAEIRAEPLPVDIDFLQALPRSLESVFHTLNVQGVGAAQVRRLWIHDPPHVPGPGPLPRVYWDGSFSFADAALQTGVRWENVTGVVACQGYYQGHGLEKSEGHISLERASIFRQPLEKIEAHVRVEPQAPNKLRVDNIQARLYGGQIGGEAFIDFGTDLTYRLSLTGVGLQLAEFAKQNRFGSAQLTGAARAQLYLTGVGSGADELEGGATVHVPSGRLYNLPVFLDLLKVIGLHSPDGTAFEESHLEAALHGRRVQIQRLDLLGNAVSLGGRGEVNLDGSDLKLDFYAVWGHIVQMLPAGLRDIPPWLSKNLFKITARGQLGGKIDYALAPVPGVVDPVRDLLDRMLKRRGAMTANRPLPYTPRLKGN